MADPNATALSARLQDLIATGIDSNTGASLPSPLGISPNGGGRGYVNSLYPNEIEYYAAALELVDGDDNTVDFFSFPVMFKSYRENKTNNTNIEKTMAGVVITANAAFTPFDIHMTGNFGRKFKRNPRNPDASSTPLINTVATSQDSLHQTLDSVTVTAKSKMPVFSTEYKTGYGCYKILERIIELASKQDVNFKPYKLFFYNLALNSNYLVEPISIEPNQNRESSNMIWEYNLHLKAVAPSKNINKNQSSSLKLLTDYGRLTQEAVFSSDEIAQYTLQRQQVEKTLSPVQKVILNQVRGRAFGLFNNSQKGMIQAMTELIDKPTYTGVFALNIGEGIISGINSPSR